MKILKQLKTTRKYWDNITVASKSDGYDTIGLCVYLLLELSAESIMQENKDDPHAALDSTIHQYKSIGRAVSAHMDRLVLPKNLQQRFVGMIVQGFEETQSA